MVLIASVVFDMHEGFNGEFHWKKYVLVFTTEYEQHYLALLCILLVHKIKYNTSLTIDWSIYLSKIGKKCEMNSQIRPFAGSVNRGWVAHIFVWLGRVYIYVHKLKFFVIEIVFTSIIWVWRLTVLLYECQAVS